MAALVAVHVVLLLRRIARDHGAVAPLVRPAAWLGWLLLGQLLLGAASYFGKFGAVMPLPFGVVVLTTTTHLIFGALMLVTCLAITLWAYRLSQFIGLPQERSVLTEQYSL